MMIDQKDEWMHGCIDNQINECRDVLLAGWMDRWIDGWMDGWIYGWIVG